MLLATWCGSTLGRPVTAGRAGKVASAWLRSDAPFVQADYHRPIRRIETVTDEAGEPIYYVVGIRPGGFVIVSADDEVEPVIAYNEEGDFDASAGNPLFALATSDLKGRVSTVRAGNQLRNEKRRARAERAKKKW
ncbi:MAG: Spi family protease inhibitor, partial [Planctomycetota bacterium]